MKVRVPLPTFPSVNEKVLNAVPDPRSAEVNLGSINGEISRRRNDCPGQLDGRQPSMPACCGVYVQRHHPESQYDLVWHSVAGLGLLHITGKVKLVPNATVPEGREEFGHWKVERLVVHPLIVKAVWAVQLT